MDASKKNQSVDAVMDYEAMDYEAIDYEAFQSEDKEPCQRHMTRGFCRRLCSTDAERRVSASEIDNAGLAACEGSILRKRKTTERQLSESSLTPSEAETETETEVKRSKVKPKPKPMLFSSYRNIVVETPYDELEDEPTKASKEAVNYGTGDLQVLKNNLGVRGLYAGRFFQNGCYITKVDGTYEAVNNKRLKAIKNDEKLCSHLIMVSPHHVIHGYQEPVEGYGAGSLANDGSISDLHPSNAEFMLMDAGDIYLRATRDIKAGEEVLADYDGKGHWDMVKKHNPEVYQAVFQDSIRTAKQVKVLFGFPPLSKSTLDDALPAFKSTPIPALPEWEGEIPSQWSNALLRYVMFKRKLAAESILNEDVVSQLNPESDEYLDCLTAYLKTTNILSKRPNKAVEALNKLKSKLRVPANGIFPSVTSGDKNWRSQYINYFNWKAGTLQKKLTRQEISFILHKLNPSNLDYRQLILLYFKPDFPDLDSGKCIDFSTQKNYHLLSHICSNFCTNKIPLPTCLTEGQHAHWTHEAVTQLLNIMGFDVKRKQPARGLHEKLSEAVEKNNQEEYYDIFERLCQNYNFDYESLYSYRKSKNKNYPMPLLPDNQTGVKWDEKHHRAYLIALYLTGCKISTEALAKATFYQMGRVLTLIDREKHKQKFNDILAIVATAYKTSETFKHTMDRNGIQPARGKTWDQEYWDELKSKAKFNIQLH